MPTYEYECKKCGHFDAFQKMSDDPLQACPSCGGHVRRLIVGGGGIIFKGSGFYVTDKGGRAGAADKNPPDKSKKAEESASSGVCASCPHAEKAGCEHKAAG
jgi:putative FmdB family regulatory protein